MNEKDGDERMTDLTLSSQVTAIVSILEDDVGHRERQTAQQADSVRYLNELNKVWIYSS
jgi:hypothetical protein